jgi:hypothetical protein
MDMNYQMDMEYHKVPQFFYAKIFKKPKLAFWGMQTIPSGKPGSQL